MIQSWFSAPYVVVNINETPVCAYIDTGAFTTILADDVYFSLFQDTPPALAEYEGNCFDANGNPLTILGKASALVHTPTGAFTTTVLVYQKTPKMGYQILIGMNILSHATIDLKRKELQISYDPSKDEQIINSPQLNIEFPEAAIPIQGTPRAILSTQPNDLDEPGQEKSARETQEKLAGESLTQASKPVHPRLDSVPIYITKDLAIPPCALHIVNIPINHQHIEEDKDLLVYQNIIDQQLVVPNACTKINEGLLTIMLANLSESGILLKAGTKLTRAEYLTASGKPNIINKVDESDDTNKTKDSYPPLTRKEIQCDDLQVVDKLLEILNRYRSTCWLPGESLGHYTKDKLKIKLKTDTVINKPQYRIPYAYHAKLDEAVKEMLDQGIIAHSKSSFNSPLLIVKKPDGGIRVCLDFRLLNQVIEPVSYPLPRIHDLLNNLGGANVMSTIDLANAFHQCEIDPADQEKTAFTVRNSKYHYVRVPFGIQSAPGFFARVINDVLYDVLGANCLAYLDDLILFNANKEQHLDTLEAVMKALSQANIKLKVSKCRFFANQIKFLGYQVNRDGLTMDPSRIDAINTMPLPTNKKGLQAFLGVVNYYRIFVRDFASLAEPLYELLRKQSKFKWTDRQTQAVNILKSKLASAPIVQFPDFSRRFYLHTDASNTGIGAVLMQEKNGLLHPLAYVSKTLNEAQRRYATTKKEALSLVYALEQFRHMILMFPISVYTDHKPLLGALTKPTKDECLQRWSLLIQEYKIDLQYLEGKKNIFADTLSRLPQPTSLNLNEQFQNELSTRNSFNTLNDYLPVKLPWDINTLKEAQQKDESCQSIIRQLNNKARKGDEKVPKQLLINCRIYSGILFVLRIIKRVDEEDRFLVFYVPDSLMRDAFKTMHEDIIAGHKGSERTLKLFSRNFYNRREKPLIDSLVQTCELCIKSKGLTKPVPIKTFPIPSRPFHTIVSDIIGPLPITEKGNRFILTFRDYVTRYTMLFPMQHKTSDRIIDCLRQVFSYFGSPEVFLSDNAKEYVSEKLTKFLSYYNTKKKTTTPYHPASGGFAERINKEVNVMLRIFLSQHATHDWDEFLNPIQLCINNTYNASLQETPFFALHGFDGASTALNPPRFSYGEDRLTEHMQRIISIRDMCRKKLLQAQDKYTEYANAEREEKVITPGSRVFANLDKHKSQPKHKLDLPNSGPFKVLNSTGAGNGWILEELSTGKKYNVHADFIVGRSITRHPEDQPNMRPPGDPPDPPPRRPMAELKKPPQHSPAEEVEDSNIHLPVTIKQPQAGETTASPSTEEEKKESPHPRTEEEKKESPLPKTRVQPHRACKKFS